MTDKYQEEVTEAATEVEKPEMVITKSGSFIENYKRKDPKWGTLTKEGLTLGRGDNKKVVAPDEVYELAKLWCSYQEMADFFGVNRETLKYNFRDLIVKAREDTKANLRRAQIKLAMSGNAVMLIWLGKNILSQQDNPLDSGNNQPLPWDETD
tara:strand:+ start:1291 stop:1749 length:459 start_codon:yes stop_codon:yes gene_type:complete